jgi:hypothetical protein
MAVLDTGKWLYFIFYGEGRGLARKWLPAVFNRLLLMNKPRRNLCDKKLTGLTAGEMDAKMGDLGPN